jgi:uncharacterized phiE125 gp8 family phage protein
MIDWTAKEPGEVEAYSHDFASELAAGETVTGHSVTAVGVTKDSDALNGSTVEVTLSGGTLGTLARVTISATTSTGRTLEEIAALEIGEGPVSLARARAHLRIDWADEDELVFAYLRAAVDAIERHIGRALSRQAFTDRAPRFPNAGERLTLLRDPVTEITAVTYVDGDGAVQTLDAADYRSIEGEPWSIIAPLAGSFPSTEEREDAVRVAYVAGYDAGACPPSLQSAVLLLLGHLYQNREAVNVGNIVTAMPMAVQFLCEPFRRCRVY